MAARTVKIRHDEETRAKIQTSQLLNRLNDHVFNGVDVSQTQMKAIEILLRKTLPDLSSTSIDQTTTHEVGNSVADLMRAIDGRTRSK